MHHSSSSPLPQVCSPTRRVSEGFSLPSLTRRVGNETVELQGTTSSGAGGSRTHTLKIKSLVRCHYATAPYSGSRDVYNETSGP